LSIALALFLLPSAALAMEATQQRRFNRIMRMTMAELTTKTVQLLEQKYPDHDWE